MLSQQWAVTLALWLAKNERCAIMTQAAYKQELSSSYGIAFDSLLCLNNMPIKRYVDYLQRRGQLEEYMQVHSLVHTHTRGCFSYCAER